MSSSSAAPLPPPPASSHLSQSAGGGESAAVCPPSSSSCSSVREINNDYFSKLFDLKGEHSAETLHYDCLCSLCKKASRVHGRLYASTHLLCFHSDTGFGSVRLLMPWTEIAAIHKQSHTNEMEVVWIKEDKRSSSLTSSLSSSSSCITKLLETHVLLASFVNLDKTVAKLTALWEGANKTSSSLVPPSTATTATMTATSSASASTPPAPPRLPSPVISPPLIMPEEGLLVDEENKEGVDGFLHRTDKGIETLNVEFPSLTPLQWFATFYGDTESGREFMKKLHEDRKDTNVKEGAWKAHEEFGKIRERTFQYAMAFPIGPSVSRVEETLRCAMSRGTIVIEVVTYTLDIPYSDYFRSENLWIVEPNSKTSGCSLTVFSKLRWLKKTAVKMMIESSFLKTNRSDLQHWYKTALEHLRTSDSDSLPGAQPHKSFTSSSAPSLPTLPAVKPSTIAPVPSARPNKMTAKPSVPKLKLQTSTTTTTTNQSQPDTTTPSNNSKGTSALAINQVQHRVAVSSLLKSLQWSVWVISFLWIMWKMHSMEKSLATLTIPNSK